MREAQAERVGKVLERGAALFGRNMSGVATVHWVVGVALENTGKRQVEERG